MRAIRGRLSGLAQPSYVLHIPGGYGKVPIAPTYLEKDGDKWIVTDYLGGRHQYPPPENEGEDLVLLSNAPTTSAV
jgi:lysine 2,3-aminomutase